MASWGTTLLSPNLSVPTLFPFFEDQVMPHTLQGVLLLASANRASYIGGTIIYLSTSGA